MTVFFNNDLTPCNGVDDGVETRMYFCRDLSTANRLDDCLDGYPEGGEDSAEWKLIPESCDDGYVYPDEAN